MKIEIALDIDSLKDSLRMESSFIARGSSDDNGNLLYDAARITDQEKRLLQSHISTAITEMEIVLSEFLDNYSEYAKYKIILDHDISDYRAEAIKNSVTNYIAARVLWLFYEVNYPTVMEHFAGRTTSLMKSIKEFIYQTGNSLKVPENYGYSKWSKKRS